MKRAAWTNFVLAIWLIAFIVFGLGDSTSATELAGHGLIVILLVVGWEMLATTGLTFRESALQLGAGVLLCLAPFAFGHAAISLVGITDLAIGSVATAIGLAELITMERRHVSQRPHRVSSATWPFQDSRAR